MALAWGLNLAPESALRFFRIIAAEPLPISANEMLLYALLAIRREDAYGSYRVFLDGLIAACTAKKA